MACLHPIAIKNRKYVNQPTDYVASQLYLYPEDVMRQTLLVPCGRCFECLRAERNDWYVRLNREFAYQKSMGMESWFVTLTIAPHNYEKALNDPSGYIRSFFESLRHKYGKSCKHAFFQEFSPTKGRLHFHGCIFGCPLPYAALHNVAKKFGFIYIRPLNTRSIRYVVKYIVKDIRYCDGEGRLLDRKYRRKFVSAGVGSYLGTFPPPTFSNTLWTFKGNGGIEYRYRIPRYYDKYISEEERRKRAVYSAFLAAQELDIPLASAAILEVAESLFEGSAGRVFSSDSVCKSLRRRQTREAYSSMVRQLSPDPDLLSALNRDQAINSFDTPI